MTDYRTVGFKLVISAERDGEVIPINVFDFPCHYHFEPGDKIIISGSALEVFASHGDLGVQGVFHTIEPVMVHEVEPADVIANAAEIIESGRPD